MLNSQPNSFYIHPASIVDTDDIGSNTTIWAFVHILKNVKIGHDCNVCDHCFIESGVAIGDNVTIKSGIYIWEGVEIESNVFLGPNVVFTNDNNPRSKNSSFKLERILVRHNASIGANATILPNVTIGCYSLVGAGAVITRDVPDYALVYGNPARQHGWVGEDGQKLIEHPSELNKYFSISENRNYIKIDGKLSVCNV